MNSYSIHQSKLTGEITVPPSKSQTLRALLFAALADGKSQIYNYLHSPDTEAMIKACRLFGAKIQTSPYSIEVEGVAGKIQCTNNIIDAGNSGIVLRFCSAIGALGSIPLVVTGDHSIQHNRPMNQLISSLNQLGVLVNSIKGDGYAPIILRGPLKSGSATLSGEDSQPVSALLIASAFAEGPIELNVLNPGEKSWVALTLDWFDRLSIRYTNHQFEKFCLPGRASYAGFQYTVPGDLSSAAFPIVAALITHSEIIVRNIDMNDSQGDKEFIRVCQKMGARIDEDDVNKILYVRKGGSLKGLTLDINNFIDSIAVVAVLACFAEGETHIQNAAIARKKECNRIAVLVSELKKMGANITETQDGLIVKKSILYSSEDLYSYQDHRIAMALSVMAMGVKGHSKVSAVQCIKKTFPGFVSDFQSLGAILSEEL
jgi:3-phosphoshikimate 1-carboxyvinyltransferase